jgi:hypothetical protein
MTLCIGVATTHAQKQFTTTGGTSSSTVKIDSIRMRQYQRVLDDVCVQSATIKRDLPAATRQRALAATKAVMASWRSAPGKEMEAGAARNIN